MLGDPIVGCLRRLEYLDVERSLPQFRERNSKMPRQKIIRCPLCGCEPDVGAVLLNRQWRAFGFRFRKDFTEALGIPRSVSYDREAKARAKRDAPPLAHPLMTPATMKIAEASRRAALKLQHVPQ